MAISGDSSVETSTVGWFSRIGRSILGVLFGPLLIAAAVMLLGWNEGRSARTSTAINEGQKNVVKISPDAVIATNEGKLVYVTGAAVTDKPIKDPLFGVTQTALKLRREVQMFQWKEKSRTKTTKNFGGGETRTTEYSYEQVWSEDLIDSRKFNRQHEHRNPDRLPVSAETYVANDAHLGAFQLPPRLIEKIDGDRRLKLDSSAGIPSKSFEIGSPTIQRGGYYFGEDPSSPAVGDVMVSFSYVPLTDVSVVAEQNKNSLQEYVTGNGTDIVIVKAGIHSSNELFQSARDENEMLTWIMRIFGLFLSIAGFALIMRPISVFADLIPVLGSILGVGTALLAVAMGLIVSMITVACSWLAFRPFAAILLIAASVGVCMLVYRRRPKRTAPSKDPVTTVLIAEDSEVEPDNESADQALSGFKIDDEPSEARPRPH